MKHILDNALHLHNIISHYYILKLEWIFFNYHDLSKFTGTSLTLLTFTLIDYIIYFIPFHNKQTIHVELTFTCLNGSWYIIKRHILN